MKSIRTLFLNRFTLDVLHLIFPNLCLACERELAAYEQHLCSFCQSELNPTRYHRLQEASPLDQLFWGRTPVNNIYAHYFFEKRKAVQDILFAMKYANNRELGVYYGKEIGKELKDGAFAQAEAILPVPLHPKKEFIRGYNQSEYLALGLSDALNIPVDTGCVKRTAHTSSQTKKTRFQRWENVSGIFAVHTKIKDYKHVLIIDDVITTGSTIEAMINALRSQHPDLLVSVVTLACA